MKHLILILLFINSINLYSQSNDTIFFNEDWKEIETREGAFFYRLIEQTQNGFILRDYFLPSHKIQMEANLSELNPKEVWDGKAVWYFENGTISKEGNYVDGNRKGVFTEYYESGQKKNETEYIDEPTLPGRGKVLQVWDPEGNEVLENGSGQLELFNTETNTTDVWIYEDYRLSASGTKEDGAIFTIVDQNASFPGGINGYKKYLKKNLKYPREARKRKIQGKIYVQFIVNEDGSISDVKTVKGVDPLLDNEAARVIRASPKWNPGMQMGIPVRQRMIIPLVFKL